MKKRPTHPAAWHPQGGESDLLCYLQDTSKAALIDIVLDLVGLAEGIDIPTVEQVAALANPRLKIRDDRDPMPSVRKWAVERARRQAGRRSDPWGMNRKAQS